MVKLNTGRCSAVCELVISSRIKFCNVVDYFILKITTSRGGTEYDGSGKPAFEHVVP